MAKIGQEDYVCYVVTYMKVFAFRNSAEQRSELLPENIAIIKASIFSRLSVFAFINPSFILLKLISITVLTQYVTVCF